MVPLGLQPRTPLNTYVSEGQSDCNWCRCPLEFNLSFQLLILSQDFSELNFLSANRLKKEDSDSLTL